MNIFTKAALVIASGLGLTDPRLYQFYSGGETYAGESVGVAGAMQLDTVWACVRLISQTIATLPLFLYTKDSKGRGIVDPSQPLYRILHDQPNADMTSTEFWEAMVAAVLLWGNGYALIQRLGNRIVSLVPMLPERLTEQRNPDGSLKYTYRWYNESIDYTEDEIFHIKGFSLDGVVGISPIAQARQTLATAVAAEKTAASVFRNGMRPSAVVEAPKFLSPAQRIDARAVIDGFSGAISTGKVPLLEGGWQYKQISFPPDDAQLLETRSFHVEQLCRWFDVPPIMIGHMEKSTAWGTGMEQMMLWFLTFSLRPHLKRIEQAIAKDLLTPVERTQMYAEFNVEGLLRTDSKGRAELYQSLAMNGLRTRNELRALDNEPPLPGGDELTVQVNLIPIQLLGTVARLPTEKPVDPGFVGPKPPVAADQENQDAPQ